MARESTGKISPFFLGPVVTWLAVSSLAAFLQLLVLVARLFSLRPDEPDELYGSAFLLTRRFKKHFLGRIGLLMAGNFILPLWLFNFLSSGQVSSGLFMGLSVTSFVISLVSELLGRYLFFVTVVPKNIPGSFFSRNGSGH